MESHALKALIGIAIDCIGGAAMNHLVPENFNWLGWPLLVFGTILLAWGIAEYILNHLKWRFFPNWSFKFGALFPFTILIPLEKASQIAYEKSRGTEYAETAEKIVKTTEKVSILDYFSCALAEKDEPLYAAHPPSTKIEIVNRKEMGWIQNDGRDTGRLDGSIVYKYVMIRRNRLHEFVREVRRHIRNMA